MGLEENEKWLLMGKGFFWRWWNVLILDGGDGCTTVNTKSIELCTLNGWTACELYLSKDV